MNVGYLKSIGAYVFVANVFKHYQQKKKKKKKKNLLFLIIRTITILAILYFPWQHNLVTTPKVNDILLKELLLLIIYTYFMKLK